MITVPAYKSFILSEIVLILGTTKSWVAGIVLMDISVGSDRDW